MALITTLSSEIPAFAGMTRGNTWGFLLIPLTVLVFLTELAFANIQTVSAKAQISSSTQTKVTVEYLIDSLPTNIDFKIIRFDQVEISDLKFSSKDGVLEHTFNRADFPLVTGFITFKDPAKLINITYLVKSDQTESKIIPIVLLDLKPPPAASDVFTATVSYPNGFEVQQSFPSLPWTISGQQATFEMQVVPSVIKAELVPPGGTGLDRTTLIDAFVLILLVVLSYFGWKRLKSQNI